MQPAPLARSVEPPMHGATNRAAEARAKMRWQPVPLEPSGTPLWGHKPCEERAQMGGGDARNLCHEASVELAMGPRNV
eukprot:9292531-Pyramimonas_sp.AAC.1